ncbi:cell division protein ZipA [Marinobacter sp. CHS3-4]|uniref:cell division protein ZipA n=1 Tax=Marinobacter sp. CHS3-4 TaxID=3045174 RepID=UPI0024B5D4DA|nr:cell division protein ZipA [Marinobacter sp. CHS3-4]MDI9245263.1 cell division protein ZipA [Marinobacter sp. CHS3-4]
MSLREWLIAIGTIVIIGVVIDGIRRMRRARKESVAISSGMGADDLDGSPLDDEYNPELPNGGARTISRDTLEDRGYVKPERSRFGKPSQKPTRPVVDSSSTQESVDEPEESPSEHFSASRDDGDVSIETGWGAGDDSSLDGDDGVLGKARVVGAAGERSHPDSEPAEMPQTGVPPVVTTEVEEDTASRKPVESKSDQPLAGANRPDAREVVVINVLSKNGEPFNGEKLKALFEACGLEHGDLDIYHRHEDADTYSPVQFSVASAVEPGTFKPHDMATLSTPGISFFMSMPGPSNSLQAFEFMLETAQCVVRNLGGELKDERRSVMTAQTIEHCRQRIREFERKQRSPGK